MMTHQCVRRRVYPGIWRWKPGSIINKNKTAAQFQGRKLSSSFSNLKFTEKRRIRLGLEQGPLPASQILDRHLAGIITGTYSRFPLALCYYDRRPHWPGLKSSSLCHPLLLFLSLSITFPFSISISHSLSLSLSLYLTQTHHLLTQRQTDRQIPFSIQQYCTLQYIFIHFSLTIY